MKYSNKIKSVSNLEWWRAPLSSAPFYASLLVTLVLGVFIGLFWTVNEYHAYQESIENIKHNYNKQYQVRVREELGKVVDFVEYKRSQSDMRIENELRDKVQSAYSIAAHIYSLNKDIHSVEEIKDMVIEMLRPIRWSNGKGYYFVGRVKDQTIDLFSDEPYYEGKTVADFKDGAGRMVVSDITDIIDRKGAGLYRYKLLKPAFPKLSFAKISFVKYFEPFDWFIGAGIYSEDLEKDLQEDVLGRIQKMTFGNDGDVLGFRDDGTIIVHSDERLIGRSIIDMHDSSGIMYGQKMLVMGTGDTREGYTQYGVQKIESDPVRQKLSYVQAYPDWGWILSAGMFMDEMEQAIEDETVTYKTISFRNVSMFIIMFVIAVCFLLFAAFIYSRKIKKGITLFTEFFREAADSKVKIKNTDLPFMEFEVIGSLANQMVDDRIQKERILQRNELRLDTLLRLGMMDKYSLQQKYDFILQRVVEITESEGGYLALVNNSQSYLTLSSVVENKNIQLAENQYDSTVCRVEDAGLAGNAVMERKAMAGIHPPQNMQAPYSGKTENYLDVPIYDGEKIVLVCGVRNRETLYENTDIRQVNMLLEGLWLHVLKTCSEKELANLERQVIAISQEERSRIGQDLHDGLCSHLSGVELLSKALQQKLEKKNLEEAGQLGMIRGLINEAIDKTGHLARGLYPVHVIDQGLMAAFEELVSEVEGSYNVTCSLSFDSPLEWGDNNVATHLYYIVREAVFNAAKHGKAQHISIKLTRGTDSFLVRISDDGRGFVEAKTKKGMGLHTMKYRAKGIGASLVIESNIDRGTSIVISGEVE